MLPENTTNIFVRTSCESFQGKKYIMKMKFVIATQVASSAMAFTFSN
jgi:hypothetical protein